MVKTTPGHGSHVANRIAEIDAFSEAYSITGQYDLLTKFYIEDIDGIAASSNGKSTRSPTSSRRSRSSRLRPSAAGSGPDGR
jgi:DNA-binding Lrp family transcriptional regulator